MRIGLIAPPWVPVPPIGYGGTEQVVHDLALGLVQRGHDVRLFTIGESTCPVPSQWYFARAVTPLGTTVAESAHALAAYHALADCDLIHDHTILGPLIAGRIPDLPPVVATNHGAFSDEARVIYREIAKTASVVAISRSHRASAPDVPVAAVILHGIDLATYSFGAGEGGYLVFVGRMSADKGVHRAISVARSAGMRLRVISKMREPEEHLYFKDTVRPLLGEDVELMDELSADERIACLRSAKALLNPISWCEPFGLVMAESLACGTPVLAFPNGAAPEIVDHGRTGFLCADEAEMVAAVARLGEIDRQACRIAAEARFGMARMAEEHVRLYEQVLAQPPSRVERPRSSPSHRSAHVRGHESAPPESGWSGLEQLSAVDRLPGEARA